MKQGTASVSGPLDRKVEPSSKAVNPGAVSQIGCHEGTRRAIEPMYQGRGFEAPSIGQTNHHCGSQGKHK